MPVVLPIQAPDIMERTLRLVQLLRDAEEVKAPRGIPCEGKVVSYSDAKWVKGCQRD